MPLSNCPRCKKMFNKMTMPVCTECEAAEDEDYAKVRKLLSDQPDLSMERAAELAGVEVVVVNRMVSQGIITSVDANAKVTCGKCGAPAISVSKRLCPSCLDQLNLKVAEVQRSLAVTIQPQPKVQSKLSVRRKIDER